MWEFAVAYLNDIVLNTKDIFFRFLFHLLNIQQILNVFKKKMIVIGNVLLVLETVKDLVTPLSKKHRFRTSLEVQFVKGSQKLLKSACELFYHIFSSLWGDMSWKVSPLVKFGIFGVSVNTLSADDKYPVRDCENFQFPIQMQ